jgi:glycosyltransferase involved in cell wall biosynthesis
MQRPPRITIVTSSFNQGRFIERTIRSILEQDYPNLEHLVVDGMSTDETVSVLARYPHLRVIREPDSGQAEAINKGFRAATGEIFGFVNSDDTLERGALKRVADEIDPDSGRHIVMGRCRFIDEHDRFLGIEHPSGFESHLRVLEIWKGHLLPQPAVFWTREVWERCGPLDEREHLMLDYDLFCRFSREYTFHPIDQVLANYRLHTASKTESIDDRKRLEAAIVVSRRYWGSWTHPQFWRILLSYGRFRLDRRHRASRLLAAAHQAWSERRPFGAIPKLMAGAALGPDVAIDAWVVPGLKPGIRAALRARSKVQQTLRSPAPAPQSLAWRDFVDLHADGWAGPRLVQAIDVAPGDDTLVIDGRLPVGNLPSTIELEAIVDGCSLGRRAVECRQREFSVSWPLGQPVAGRHQLHVVSSAHTVPHDVFGNDDYRPLSFKLERLAVIRMPQGLPIEEKGEPQAGVSKRN